MRRRASMFGIGDMRQRGVHMYAMPMGGQDLWVAGMDYEGARRAGGVLLTSKRK